MSAPSWIVSADVGIVVQLFEPDAVPGNRLPLFASSSKHEMRASTLRRARAPGARRRFPGACARRPRSAPVPPRAAWEAAVGDGSVRMRDDRSGDVPASRLSAR
jgi:hypothetical protein